MSSVTPRAARLALASLFTALLAACSGGGSAEPDAAPPPPPPVNTAPVATFGVSATTVTAGAAVSFDANASSDADGDTLAYSWDFGDGTRGGGATIAHLYAHAGSYTATLTVADGRGGVTRSTRALTATAAAAPGPSVVVHGTVGDMTGVLAGVTVQQVGGSVGASTAADGTVSLSLATGTPLLLHLSKPGYADQFVPLQMPQGATTAEFTAGLLPREAAVTLDAGTGGRLAGKHGASLTLEAGALVDATGAAVSGAVQVSITPLDIRGGGRAQFPGAFSGVLPNGQTVPILSHGTVEYQLSANGQPVQIAPGKTAAIELPVYASRNLDGSAVVAGQTIPLWSLDEQTGQWVNEGQGTVVASAASPTGLALRTRVAHLSWWNADVPLPPEQAYGALVTCMLRATPTSALQPVSCSLAPPLPSTFDLVAATAAEPPAMQVRTEVPVTGSTLTLPRGQGFSFLACSTQGPKACGAKVIGGDPQLDSLVVIELVPVVVDSCTGTPQSVSAPQNIGVSLRSQEIHCFTLVVPASQVLRVGASADPNSAVSGKKRVKNSSGTVLAEGLWSATQPDAAPLRLTLAAGSYVLEIENTTFVAGAATVVLSELAPMAVAVPSVTTVTLASQDAQAFNVTPAPGTLLLATSYGATQTLSSSLSGVTDTSVSGWASLMLQPGSATPVSVLMSNGFGTQTLRFKVFAPPRLVAGTPQDASLTLAEDLLVKQFVYDAAGGETIAIQARMPAGYAGNPTAGLRVFDASGAELEPSANVSSKFRNSHDIVALTLPAAGPYRIDLPASVQTDVAGLSAGLAVLPAPVALGLGGEATSVSSSIDTLAGARGHRLTLARGDLISVDVDAGTGPTRLRPIVYLRQPGASGSPYRAPAFGPLGNFNIAHPGDPLVPVVLGSHALSDPVAVPADGDYLVHVLGGASGNGSSVAGLSLDGTTGPYTLTVHRPAGTPLAPNTAQALTVPALGFAHLAITVPAAGVYLLCSANVGGAALATRVFDNAGVEQVATLLNGRAAWSLAAGSYHWAVRPTAATGAVPITALWQLGTDALVSPCN